MDLQYAKFCWLALVPGGALVGRQIGRFGGSFQPQLVLVFSSFSRLVHHSNAPKSAITSKKYFVDYQKIDFSKK